MRSANSTSRFFGGWECVCVCGRGVGGIGVLFLLNASSKEYFLEDGIHPLFQVTTPIPITSCCL